MAKKQEKTENFFANNIFMYDSYCCEGQIVDAYLYPGECPEKALKIKADAQKPIRFAFASKAGLVRINEDGSIAESNLLGKLLAIKSSKIENYLPFFERNGFLFPISTDSYETITSVELQAISGRLCATLELMSTITDMSRTSYEKIARLIFYHLFSPVVEVEVKDGKFKYQSSHHSYTQLLDNADMMKRDDKLNDIFNNEEFSFNDSVGSISINAEFIDTMLSGKPPEDKYDNDLFMRVLTTYCSPRDSLSAKNRLYNDFIFRYMFEVGIVDHVDLENIYYYKDEVNKGNYSAELKKAAVKIAKLIIRDEIDLNLRRVRPTYNIDKLEPAWRIDSLLSALYFGLFYMRPGMEIYRRCANPKCGEYFLVSVSSQKKKYCCKACMSRDMQARHRAKVKKTESAMK